MIALVFVNAALSCAVLTSELRHCRRPHRRRSAHCAHTLKAATAPPPKPLMHSSISFQPIVRLRHVERSSLTNSCFFRCDDAEVGAAHLRQFYLDPTPEAWAVSQTAVRSRVRRAQFPTRTTRRARLFEIRPHRGGRKV